MSTIEVMRKALEALEEIALAGMGGTGQESEEGMRDWHARQAWKFIGIAARQLDELRAEIERLDATPGPTCQTFGDGIAVPCAECNTVLIDSQELAALRARAAPIAPAIPALTIDEVAEGAPEFADVPKYGPAYLAGAYWAYTLAAARAGARIVKADAAQELADDSKQIGLEY